MRPLWDLTRRIAAIVGILQGRLSKLERELSSQERRVSDLEDIKEHDLHSMEVQQSERVEREDARQEELSDSQLRSELETKYGTTKWAKDLISSIIFGRRRKTEIEH